MLKTYATQLGLDHGRILPGLGSFPVACRLLHKTGGEFRNDHDRNQFLFWSIMSSLRGRFSASRSSLVGRDLSVVDGGGSEDLLRELESWLDGEIDLAPSDFNGNRRQPPSLALLYMVEGAAVTLSGDRRQEERRRPIESEQIIFPRAELNDVGVPTSYANAIANYVADLAGVMPRSGSDGLWKHLDRLPEHVLTAHCIPLDKSLWRPEMALEFFAERRRLLATAAQRVLDNLRGRAERSGGVGPTKDKIAISLKLDPVSVIE